ncbi:MAG: tRNA uridine(34) 5-carboxymethylaminomethyl modification radical SAM/GNAT enzyme Elp3 [Anaerolineales bacterium]|nr:tRNA uridine(34) 5-carboxymethylaminomethyl modification radical SAM/GNAT enzyme Elp3 [Anaerolineales bacterium]
MEFTEKRQRWKKINALTPKKMELAHFLLEKIRAGEDVMTVIRRHPLEGGGYLNKAALVAAYKELVDSGAMQADTTLLERIRMKPMRTLSGVTTVTVLTKPYPCPGKCIFCPTDVRMPKSYLPDEPGAMRALEHEFDPFTQVESRIRALKNLGHPTDKIELLILGGTWSSYKRDYQEWFVARCFDAMNGLQNGLKSGAVTPWRHLPTFESQRRESLESAQSINETAPHRNVGLVIETRPDEINPDELRWLRHLGVTKVQMGAQSFDDHILEINKRGHDVESTRNATALLRAAGFKIVLHWMPNLLGATPQSDREDFARLWNDFCPDEIKIYPNQLLANAELYEYWQRGEFQPYTTEELVHLIADIKPSIPRYCRVNRVIRDIPGNNVVDGNRRTSLRQDVHEEMKKRGAKCQCIRCREVKGKTVELSSLKLNDLVYRAGQAEEHFISFNSADDGLAGFIRLSLPSTDSPETGMTDLTGAALIREVHVYGQSLGVGVEKIGAAQHVGLGTRLLEEAEKIAKQKNFHKLAVIAAVGTRPYYLDRGFERGEYYLVKEIK